MHHKDTDYHIHTTYSDGALTPEQIVDRYISNGYSGIAVTDHDTIEGSAAAFRYAADKPINVIPGIEISTHDEEWNTIHILGYNFDYESRELADAIAKVKRWRTERNEKLLKALNKMGYEVSMDDAMEINEGRFMGKPTIAEVLVRKGYIKSVGEAFDNLYKRPEIKNIWKETLGTWEAIDVIHKAGGIAVFAHPMEVMKKDESEEAFAVRLKALLKKMIEHGIDGIECYHPSADASQSEKLEAFAKSNGLIVSGGSDFHSDAQRRYHES